MRRHATPYDVVRAVWTGLYFTQTLVICNLRKPRRVLPLYCFRVSIFYRWTLNRALLTLCFHWSVVESPSTPSTKDNESMHLPLSATDLQGPDEQEVSSSAINSDFWLCFCHCYYRRRFWIYTVTDPAKLFIISSSTLSYWVKKRSRRSSK